ncbi:unnamed protein product [Gongylonema pulchrum]|uniref:Uncharacterized protein n=1 Tax=Gongylonema pulchrum TaxID=637853 RepID=A0A183DKT5_9BILA|nr:unnamed protein product [Gongylonema pulchrum]
MAVFLKRQRQAAQQIPVASTTRPKMVCAVVQRASFLGIFEVILEAEDLDRDQRLLPDAERRKGSEKNDSPERALRWIIV